MKYFTSIVAAFLLSSCALQTGVVGGEVLGKTYYEGCRVARTMGTASGPLVYDELIDPAYVVEVQYEQELSGGESRTVTAGFHVSEEDFTRIEVGDDFTREYAQGFHDDCEREREDTTPR